MGYTDYGLGNLTLGAATNRPFMEDIMSEGILGGNLRAVSLVQLTIDPASVAAATTAEQTFTVVGVQPGDQVDVRKPTLTAGIGVVNARVSAANTVAITFSNSTAGAIDPPAEVYSFIVLRFGSSVTSTANFG